MAGGSGTRLWPLSRAGYPKQFLSLHGDATMLQSTVERLSDLPVKSTITICNEEHRFFVAEQLRKVGRPGSILLEPVGRNTAPAVTLAALSCDNDDPLLLVLAADHVIADEDAFTRAVERAIPMAESGKLVTFGIVPTQAHTGYGYIEAGDAFEGGFFVKSFIEKPNLSAAEEYLESGNYHWNSGMFLFKASSYLDELKAFRPEIFEVCSKALAEAAPDLDFLRIPEDIFSVCPAESIDHAVFENTLNAVVIPVDAGWNDIGSWNSLWDISEKDRSGNACSGDVILECTKNAYIRSEDKLVAAIGANDMVIVSTKDAVLVAHQSHVQRVKEITSRLKEIDRMEWDSHHEVQRPWGKFESIGSGSRYQVKRITVRPGAKLSVQMHHHRAEHWVVVTGIAKVTNGDETFLLSENQSTYIPVGVVHSLENPGKTPLEIIEVQSGSYLGEDDIIRFEDFYGRT